VLHAARASWSFFGESGASGRKVKWIRKLGARLAISWSLTWEK
jgi:hypothetical protein